MKFSGEIIGSKALTQAMASLEPLYEQQIKDVLIKSVLLVHATAVKSINEVSQGHQATRYKPKREVTVSEPGDPPNKDMGTLQKSVAWEIDEENLTGLVGTNLKYGLWLEFGTKIMKARPWLLPAFKKNADKILKMYRAIRKNQQGAA
jgi:hypothetical protein